MLPSSLYGENVVERLREEIRFVNIFRLFLKSIALATFAEFAINVVLAILAYQRIISIDFSQFSLTGLYALWVECIIFAILFRGLVFAYRKICKWITLQFDPYIARKLKGSS
jgi:hypothetical protein